MSDDVTEKLLFFDTLYSIALKVVESAQPLRDGGIVNFLLKHILLSKNEQHLTAMDHVISTVNHGGYIIGTICGVLWTLFFLIVGIFLCVLHFNKKPLDKSSKLLKKFKNYSYFIKTKKHGEYDKSVNRNYLCAQFTLAIIFASMAFIGCIFGFVANWNLNMRITSLHNQDSLFPRVNNAVNNISHFLTSFTSNARNTSKPVIDDIVLQTGRLQNETGHEFSTAISNLIGGSVLQRNGEELVSRMSQIFEVMEDMQKKIAHWLDFNSKVTEMTGAIRFAKLSNYCNTTNHLNVSECLKILNVLDDHLSYYSNMYHPDCEPKAPAGFLSTMLASNQSSSSIRLQLAEGLANKHKVEEDMFLKSKNILQIEETIRKLIGQQWDETEEKMADAYEVVNDILENINNFQYPVIVKYETLRFTATIFVILLMIIVCIFSGIIIVNFLFFPSTQLIISSPSASTTKIITYVLFFLLFFYVIMTTAGFLTGGYAHTEFCRYLMQRQNANDSSELILDRIINNFITDKWPEILLFLKSQSTIPLPKPRDLLHGLNTVCKYDGPVLVAINSVESINFSDIDRPMLTKMLLDKGKQLMIDGIMSLDRSILLQPDLLTKLQQSKQLPSIVKITDDETNCIMEMKADKRRQKFNFTLVRNNAALFPSLKILLEQMIKLDSALEYENFMLESFQKLRSLQNITQLVDESISAFQNLSFYFDHKYKWIEEGKKLFDRIVVNGTKQKSSILMVQSAGNAMRAIGHCRPLYNAWHDVTYATCHAILFPFSMLWLSMGWALCFATPLSVFVLIALTATQQQIASSFDKVHIKTKNNCDNKKLLIRLNHCNNQADVLLIEDK